VPIAFIVRLGPTRGEWTTIAGAALLVLVFPALGAPTGFIAVLAITALVLRRAGAATEIASL